MSASGVRSSCPASATKPRSRVERVLETVEHLVEGHAEPLELVAGGRDRQPLAGPVGGDARGALGRIASTARSPAPASR